MVQLARNLTLGGTKKSTRYYKYTVDKPRQLSVTLQWTTNKKHDMVSQNVTMPRCDLLKCVHDYLTDKVE